MAAHWGRVVRRISRVNHSKFPTAALRFGGIQRPLPEPGSLRFVGQGRLSATDAYCLPPVICSMCDGSGDASIELGARIYSVLQAARRRSGLETAQPFNCPARQIAMAVAKELSDHRLPEVGDAFGGRDHTTVWHACRKVLHSKGRMIRPSPCGTSFDIRRVRKEGPWTRTLIVSRRPVLPLPLSSALGRLVQYARQSARLRA